MNFIQRFKAAFAPKQVPQGNTTQKLKGRVKLTAKPKRVYRAKEGKWYDVEDVWRNAK